MTSDAAIIFRGIVGGGAAPAGLGAPAPQIAADADLGDYFPADKLVLRSDGVDIATQFSFDARQGEDGPSRIDMYGMIGGDRSRAAANLPIGTPGAARMFNACNIGGAASRRAQSWRTPLRVTITPGPLVTDPPAFGRDTLGLTQLFEALGHEDRRKPPDTCFTQAEGEGK